LLVASARIGTASGADAKCQPIADLRAALIYTAEIRAMVEVCTQETPEISAHLQRAYEDWLERHPWIVKELDALRSGTPSSRVDPATLEHAAKEYSEELQRDLATNPRYFAARCNHFIEDLDTGELDYPPGQAEPLCTRRSHTYPTPSISSFGS
jgi:hypothetical protein